MDTNVTIDHDRHGLEVLSLERCWELAGSVPIGRIAFVEAGEPIILPVAHAIDQRTVVFRTAPGSKLYSASVESVVGFEVDHFDTSTRSGWSVVVRGIARRVFDPEEVERLEGLGLGTWVTGSPRTDWVRIHVDEISGRHVRAGE